MCDGKQVPLTGQDRQRRTLDPVGKALRVSSRDEGIAVTPLQMNRPRDLRQRETPRQPRSDRVSDHTGRALTRCFSHLFTQWLQDFIVLLEPIVGVDRLGLLAVGCPVRLEDRFPIREPTASNPSRLDARDRISAQRLDVRPCLIRQRAPLIVQLVQRSMAGRNPHRRDPSRATSSKGQSELPTD